MTLKSEHYRARAKECLAKAASTSVSDVKHVYRALAHEWIALAVEIEQHDIHLSGLTSSPATVPE